MDHARAQDFQPIAAGAEFAGLAVPADIHLHRGFGEGEVAGAEADGQGGDAEKGAQEIGEAALEVAERDTAIDHQAFDLVKHRRMRGVMISAIGAAGGDDANGRFLAEHGADLQRRGLGAQHQRPAIGAGAGEVEGVLVLPGGVMVGDVEGAEIIPVALNVRAFDGGEAHGAEDGGEFLDGAVDGVDGALGDGARRQGHVLLFGQQAGVQVSRGENAMGLVEAEVDRGTGLVQGGAALLAFFRRQGAQALHEGAQPALLAEEGDPHGVQFTQIGRGAHGGFRLGDQGFKLITHRGVPRKRKRPPPVTGRRPVCRPYRAV